MRTVEVTGEGLRLTGYDRVVPLLSGEVHFWRLDPADWPRVLDAVAELGFRTVSTYVSWARHELGPGVFDWNGRMDVVAFLALIHERGLHASVRIGPNTAAEQEDAGWPRRVLDDPACQARRPGGHPYLLATATHHAWMPSYASAATLAAIEGWYDEVVPRLVPLQWPDGPIVAAQVDNEMGFHFQAHAFALDYHPDAIAQYRRFLADCYSDDVAALNAAYGSSVVSFTDVEPPTDGSDEPEERRLDWIRFREHHLREALATLAGMARDRGLDRVPLLHNDYPRTTTPLDLGALEQTGTVDVAGADIYVTKEGGAYVTDLARHLAGSSRLPYMAELGTGWLTLPWLLPMRTTPLDEEHAGLRAFLGGVRAANVYMLVERDRWYASPLSARGEAREPRASFYRRLHAMLDDLEWTSLRRDAPVLFLENRDESRRVASTAILGAAVPPFAQMLPLDHRLFDGVGGERLGEWERHAATALRKAGVEFDRASTSSLPDLAGYSHVILPFDMTMDAGVWKALTSGDATILVGPALPSAVEQVAAVHVTDPVMIAEHLPSPVFRCDHRDVDLVRLAGPAREVLGAINSSAERVVTTVETDGVFALEGRWRPESVKGVGLVEIELPPWAGQVWEVTR